MMMNRPVALALTALLAGCASSGSSDVEMVSETQPDLSGDGDLVSEFLVDAGGDDDMMPVIEVTGTPPPATRPAGDGMVAIDVTERPPSDRPMRGGAGDRGDAGMIVDISEVSDPPASRPTRPVREPAMEITELPSSTSPPYRDPAPGVDVTEVSAPSGGAGAAVAAIDPVIGPGGLTINRSFHARNDHQQPVESWVVDSLASTLSMAGGQHVAGSSCEVVVVFRTRARQKWESARPIFGAHTRTTSLWTPRQSGGQAPPWHAVVEMIFEETTDGTDAPLREIRMKVARQAMIDAAFTRYDVSDLWKVLEHWAGRYPSPPAG